VILVVVPAGVRATAVSMFALVQNLMGLAVGSVLTGALADRWGLAAALATVAVLGVPAGMVLWWGSRSYGRDRARVGLAFADAADRSSGSRWSATSSTPRPWRRAMLPCSGAWSTRTPCSSVSGP
jgi:hypothetical protein